MRKESIVIVSVLLVAGAIWLFAQTNSGVTFPANGPLIPVVGAVGIGSDSGILTVYDSAGKKYVLTQASAGSIAVGSQITEVCGPSKGSIPTGLRLNGPT